MFSGICRDCGEPINYELTDVGIGVDIPHGWCSNPQCSTYGWATNNIKRNIKEEEDEEIVDD